MHKAILKMNRALLRAEMVEQHAHEMASFLGQLIDEGILDILTENQITMGGKTVKLEASRLLDRFEHTIEDMAED